MTQALTFIFLLGGYAQEFKSYSNERFGFHLSYPAQLHPIQAPANGDGRQFNSSDGQTTMLCWAGNVLSGASDLPSEYREVVRQYQALHIRPAMQVKKANWFAASWVQGNKIYYVKEIFAKDTYTALRFTYPVRLRSTMNPIVTKVVRSLVPAK